MPLLFIKHFRSFLLFFLFLVFLFFIPWRILFRFLILAAVLKVVLDGLWYFFLHEIAHIHGGVGYLLVLSILFLHRQVFKELLEAFVKLSVLKSWNVDTSTTVQCIKQVVKLFNVVFVKIDEFFNLLFHPLQFDRFVPWRLALSFIEEIQLFLWGVVLLFLFALFLLVAFKFFPSFPEFVSEGFMCFVGFGFALLLFSHL